METGTTPSRRKVKFDAIVHKRILTPRLKHAHCRIPPDPRPPLAPWLADRNAGGAWSLDEKSSGLLFHGRPPEGDVGVRPKRGRPTTIHLNARGWRVRKMSTPRVNSRERQGQGPTARKSPVPEHSSSSGGDNRHLRSHDGIPQDLPPTIGLSAGSNVNRPPPLLTRPQLHHAAALSVLGRGRSYVMQTLDNAGRAKNDGLAATTDVEFSCLASVGDQWLSPPISEQRRERQKCWAPLCPIGAVHTRRRQLRIVWIRPSASRAGLLQSRHARLEVVGQYAQSLPSVP